MSYFKGGHRDEPSNYSPVSLTGIVCKTPEHAITSEMWKHIEQNIILDNQQQHGLRKRYNNSTTTQHIHVMHSDNNVMH